MAVAARAEWRCSRGHSPEERYKDRQGKSRCRQCERDRDRQRRVNGHACLTTECPNRVTGRGWYCDACRVKTQRRAHRRRREMEPALFAMIGEVAAEYGGVGWGAIHDLDGRPLCLWGFVDEAMRRLGRADEMPAGWDVLSEDHVGAAYLDAGNCRKAEGAICPVNGLVADAKVQALLRAKGDVAVRGRRSGSGQEQARFLGRVPWPELAAGLNLHPRAHTHAGRQGGEHEQAATAAAA